MELRHGVARAREWLLLAAIILTLLVAALLSVDHGHEWGDDFALYIAHARNLVLGQPYGDTGYIYNVGFNMLGPPIYPPGLPFILTAVYSYFGLNLYAMKITLILFFLASLVMIFLFVRSTEHPVLAWMVVLVVAFNPRIWHLRNSIMTEFPFMFFLYGSLHVLTQRPGAKRGIESAAQIAAGAFALYMSLALRVVGAVLFVALVAADLWRRGRLRFTTCSSWAVRARSF